MSKEISNGIENSVGEESIGTVSDAIVSDAIVSAAPSLRTSGYNPAYSNLGPPADPAKYGFYGRLTAPFPSQIIIDTTEICNLECTHCPHPTFKKSDLYDGANLPVELNTKLADEVREHGKGYTQYLRYTGNGEPLAHPKIFEMLTYSARNSGVSVCLTSNGTLFNDKRVDQLLAADIHLIDVSIDAMSNEVYQKIRVRGNLDVTRPNVQRLIKRRNESGSKMRVVVSYVEQPGNAHETDEFERFWKGEGADFVVVRRLHSAAGAKDSVVVELKKKKNDEDRRPCLYPWERVVMNSRGHLAFCPEDWVHGSALADYRDISIRDLWQGELYASLRAAHMSNNFCNHTFCGKCPDWQLTRWPDEGRSYADMVHEFNQQQHQA